MQDDIDEPIDDDHILNFLADLEACTVPHLHHDMSFSSIEGEDEIDVAAEPIHIPSDGTNDQQLHQTQPVQTESSPSAVPGDPATSFGFKRFLPPPHIIRNSPGWLGRDDDVTKIKEVCDDIQRMTDSGSRYSVWCFDQKIASCHMKLERVNASYKQQVREVPVLHLTKQKIVNIASAYKSAGFMEIIRFMMDNDKIEDITKLISADNIRSGTRLIRRVAHSLNLALQIEFVQQLTDEQRIEILEDMDELSPKDLADKWDSQFTEHVKRMSDKDATYALHVDMMDHCFDAIAVSFAERIGGPDGYNLLCGIMKSSIPFAFTNGASQYAAFTTRLLIDHSAAPPAIQELKREFFSLPYGASGCNYGLDTIREEDHLKCKKFYRPGTNAAALSSKMNRMNEASEMIDQRQKSVSNSSDSAFIKENHCNWSLTENDIKYILKTAAMIFRQGALSQNKGSVPYNVYSSKGHIQLSQALLDREATKCGEYLLHRYCQQNGLFGVTLENLEAMRGRITGPKQLVDKVLKGSSQTVNRNRCRPDAKQPVEQQKRAKQLVKEKKKMDSFVLRMQHLPSISEANRIKVCIHEVTPYSKCINTCCRKLSRTYLIC